MEQVFGCIICSDFFSPENGSDIATVPCGHTFHKHCIDAWLVYANLCPICKKYTQRTDVRKIFLSEMSQDNRVPLDNEITTRMVSNLSKNLESSKNFLSEASAHLANV
ncbi:unnamed protein product [Rhizopus microsporus]|uniref:RING-type domain-containing protein n=1 Tax=Rhizopus microsporus TaxID=58291 RepID=A0A1X0S4K9_RHIZD|nr:hypothetical protein BCV71DRAFT_254975 [Rhizopus microsporus]